MNYKVEKIDAFWEILYTNARCTGWSVYPLQYKEKQYVVDIKRYEDKFYFNSCYCYIYEYGEEKKLFKKHKRNMVFWDDITNLKDYNISYISDETFRRLLPQIMKDIFVKFEQYEKQKSEIAKEIIEAEKWNGIIE